MKVIKNFSTEIYLDLTDLDDVINKLKHLSKFGLELVISFGGPVNLEYDDQRYYVSRDLGDLSLNDNRSKSVILYFVETERELLVKFMDGTIITKLKKV